MEKDENGSKIHIINQGKTMSITDIIKPIQLLAGTHKDTAKTGQGCFMNVIAYLNGEPQITDRSPCVCITVRKIAIQLNDMLDNTERQRMIPFIERAMGSAACDAKEFKRRLHLMMDFAKNMAVLAKKAANDANAAEAARYAAEASRYADYAASIQNEIKEAYFEYLDAVLPKPQVFDRVVLERAKALCAMV